MTTQAQQFVLATIRATSLDETRNLVTQWCNAAEVDIDDEGSIWIANPQSGHWLDDDKMDAFVRWCASLVGGDQGADEDEDEE